MVQNKDKNKLIEYLKQHTIIDEFNRELKIESFQVQKEVILQQYSNEIGGVFIRRDESQKRLDMERKIVDKRLLMNQEVVMSEFSYDVKLFQVFSKKAEKQVLSYSFEVFSLNEPDLVYRYNYALHEQSSQIHSPVHFGYDIFNLIENPHSKLR